MTQTRIRNNKDNSIAWAMSADTKAAINAEMTKNGWVDMRSFGDLIDTPANSTMFRRRCETANVRTIIVGAASVGVFRMFKAEDASKVKDLLQRINMETDVVQQSSPPRNSKGRFTQEKCTTLFGMNGDLSEQDVKRIALQLVQLLPQYNAKVTI